MGGYAVGVPSREQARRHEAKAQLQSKQLAQAGSPVAVVRTVRAGNDQGDCEWLSNLAVSQNPLCDWRQKEKRKPTPAAWR